MKNFKYCIPVLFSLSTAIAQTPIEDAMALANYAYAHTKDAYTATNTAHMYEFSEKAIEALLKVEDLTAECDCREASETAFLARESSEDALSQDTFERTRFYTKRARSYGEQLMILINECDLQRLNTSAYAANKDSESSAEEEARIAEERKEKERIRDKAESALKKLELALSELSLALETDIAYDKINDDFSTVEDITVDETKTYYAAKVTQLAKIALEQLSEYSDE